MADTSEFGPRCAALMGPYLSGKTSLLEAMLFKAGATNRLGRITEGNTVGDSSPEARARSMSVEMNVASFDYLGDSWTLIDCPGSVELIQDTISAMAVCDIAVVVIEPGADKALGAARLLRGLHEQGVPHIIFINKIHGAAASVAESVDALRGVIDQPLVLREIPIRTGDEITGYVDLASKRAFEYTEGDLKEIADVPADLNDRLEIERTVMLEALSDFDDGLLEQLLEDEVPEVGETYDHLAAATRAGNLVPVFFGSAESGHGITRLLKVLRHEAPGIAATRERIGIDADGEAVARVFKTSHGSQTGKRSIARILRGEVEDGATLGGSRVSGIVKLRGADQEKVAKLADGEVGALGRMEEVRTGDLLSPSGNTEGPAWPGAPKPVYALAIHAGRRDDEVKMAGALARLIEEDPSLSYGPNPDTGEFVLRGQGETHLRIALERMHNRNKLEVDGGLPQVAYKESIKKPVSQHARHKKQSGGHGQFGDVHIEIKPLPRGSGFQFTDSITGGVVPKQYIPAVENGVKEYLSQGPLGFPVVDVSVELTDGQFHAVDSSDQAFKTAGSLAMREGMPKCGPVLLEPIFSVTVSVPTEFMSRVQSLVSGRRGQILGFEPKEGWKGWDEVNAHMPESEILDLINELRSSTQGVGTFEFEFDRLQEITGKEADQVVKARQSELGIAAE